MRLKIMLQPTPALVHGHQRKQSEGVGAAVPRGPMAHRYGSMLSHLVPAAAISRSSPLRNASSCENSCQKGMAPFSNSNNSARSTLPWRPAARPRDLRADPGTPPRWQAAAAPAP